MHNICIHLSIGRDKAKANIGKCYHLKYLCEEHTGSLYTGFLTFKCEIINNEKICIITHNVTYVAVYCLTFNMIFAIFFNLVKFFFIPLAQLLCFKKKDLFIH